MTKANLNLNAVEAMDFFWQSVASRDKITEHFIVDTGNLPEFKLIYDNELTSESFRRVLSALSNREPFSGNKSEARFYSRNLAALEYIDSIYQKVSMIKQIRMAELIENIEKEGKNIPSTGFELLIVPSHLEDVVIKENKIIVNFFKVFVVEGLLQIGERDFKAVVTEAISKL